MQNTNHETQLATRELPSIRMSVTDFLDAEFAGQHSHFGPYFKSSNCAYVFAGPGVDPEPLVAGMSVAIASGEKFLGNAPKRARAVVVVPGTAAPQKLQKLIEANVRGHDVEVPEGLSFVVPNANYRASENRFDAADFSRKLGPRWDLAFIDGRAWGVHHGSLPNEMNPAFMQWKIGELMQGKSIVVVLRSMSTDWKERANANMSGADFAIYVESQTVNSEDGSTSFQVTMQSAHRKQKAPLEVEAVMTTDSDGAIKWTHKKIKVLTQDQRIARAKKMHKKGMSRTAIGTELGVDRRIVGRWLLA